MREPSGRLEGVREGGLVTRARAKPSTQREPYASLSGKKHSTETSGHILQSGYWVVVQAAAKVRQPRQRSRPRRRQYHCGIDTPRCSTHISKTVELKLASAGDAKRKQLCFQILMKQNFQRITNTYSRTWFLMVFEGIGKFWNYFQPWETPSR